jgi:hypothetical protein
MTFFGARRLKKQSDKPNELRLAFGEFLAALKEVVESEPAG